jgi:pilus assembly protein Flp/PilA
VDDGVAPTAASRDHRLWLKGYNRGVHVMSIRKKVERFIRDEEGLTTVEYAVAGGLIAAAVVTAFVLLGGEVETKIDCIITSLQGGTC